MLPGGVLSLHGYTTAHGFFSGICAGSKQLPFEESKDLIEHMIASALARKADLERDAAELMQPTTSTTAWVRWYQRDRNGVGRYVRTREELHAGPYAPQQGSYVYFNREVRTWDKATGEPVTKIVKEYVGGVDYRDGDLTDEQKVAKGVAAGNEGRAKELLASAKQAAEYVVWQRGRVRDWKPQPLIKR